MKKLLLLCSLFILTQPLFATSIVVLIASSYIIIGADSKRMIIDAEKNLTVTETVCKIRVVNEYCFASAGLIASAATQYSSDLIIKKQLANKKSFSKAVRSIQKEMAIALQRELIYQRKYQPRQFAKTMESGKHLLEVVVVRMVHNQPQAYVIGFEVENTNTLAIKTYSKNCGIFLCYRRTAIVVSRRIFGYGEIHGGSAGCRRSCPLHQPADYITSNHYAPFGWCTCKHDKIECGGRRMDQSAVPIEIDHCFIY